MPLKIVKMQVDADLEHIEQNLIDDSSTDPSISVTDVASMFRKLELGKAAGSGPAGTKYSLKAYGTDNTVNTCVLCTTVWFVIGISLPISSGVSSCQYPRDIINRRV